LPHTEDAGFTTWQLSLQVAPLGGSHCSPLSTMPLPHSASPPAGAPHPAIHNRLKAEATLIQFLRFIFDALSMKSGKPPPPGPSARPPPTTHP
jgi:hypothetical protein